MKIGVIGDETTIKGFVSLSIDTFPATSDKAVRKAILDMANSDYAIIFITEQAAQGSMETIERFKTVPFPAIIFIPSNRGTLNIGMSTIRKNVEKAVGTNIFFED